MNFREYLKENKTENLKKAKDLLDFYVKKFNNNEKKVRQEILDNIVNSKYSRSSNAFVDMMWDVFKAKYPS